MGDGRYYTGVQFFNIIFLTTAIIFAVIAFMVSVYKESDHKTPMTLSGICLIMALVSRFIVEVIYGEGNILFFARTTHVFLLLYAIGNAVIYYRINRQNKNKLLVFLWCLLFFCLPSFIIISEHSFEKIAYSLFVLNFILLSNQFVKYRVSSAVFTDAKKLMSEFVFITNGNNEIIYKSDRVHGQNLFRDVNKISIDEIHELFHSPSAIRNAYDKDIVKVYGQEVLYFQYSCKEIFDKAILAGYIITLTDITRLIAMLDELKISQEEIGKVNNKLLKYKEIVYDLEREKEINVIFSDIANNQYKAMQRLKQQIEAVDIGDCFVEKIDEIIKAAKNDLKDVRHAVTNYINYYDEV